MPKISDSVYLKVSIVEPILVACIYGSTFNEIKLTLQRVLSTSEINLREYIFYLIDNSFISYQGSKKTYSTEVDGLDLLENIYTQAENGIIEYQDLTVKVK